MNKQNETMTILPFDINSISTILQLDGGVDSLLSYKLVQPTPDTSELHIDIQGCDQDSISIDIKQGSIEISAKQELTFFMINDAPLVLNKNASSTISLPNGVNPSSIYSKLANNTLILYIPVSSTV